MTIDSFDVLFFTVGFLVPGFVWSAVLSMLVPSRPQESETRFLSFLTFSCVNYGLWSWILYPMFKSGFSEAHPVWSGIALFVIIFLSPIGLGIGTGLLHQREKVPGLLRGIGLRTIHPIPTAWDWFFSRSKPCWVVVTLRDQRQVFGLFHERSFASSDPTNRDFYIEAQFRLLESGEWAPLEDTLGVLISADQIAAIEFRKLLET